jgi:hypothetical protein
MFSEDRHDLMKISKREGFQKRFSQMTMFRMISFYTILFKKTCDGFQSVSHLSLSSLYAIFFFLSVSFDN